MITMSTLQLPLDARFRKEMDDFYEDLRKGMCEFCFLVCYSKLKF